MTERKADRCPTCHNTYKALGLDSYGCDDPWHDSRAETAGESMQDTGERYSCSSEKDSDSKSPARQPSEPDEIEAATRQAIDAHYCYHQFCIEHPDNVECSDRRAILNLAAIARRMQVQLEAAQDALRETMQDCTAVTYERDEARRLHDEHCMGRLEQDGRPAEEPTCVPPWRKP